MFFKVSRTLLSILANLNNAIIWMVSRGVMVIVVGNGHGDTSSNPVRD